jgi:hypothetical protein
LDQAPEAQGDADAEQGLHQPLPAAGLAEDPGRDEERPEAEQHTELLTGATQLIARAYAVQELQRHDREEAEQEHSEARRPPVHPALREDENGRDHTGRQQQVGEQETGGALSATHAQVVLHAVRHDAREQQEQAQGSHRRAHREHHEAGRAREADLELGLARRGGAGHERGHDEERGDRGRFAVQRRSEHGHMIAEPSQGALDDWLGLRFSLS